MGYSSSFTIGQIVNKDPVLTQKQAEMIVDMFLSGIAK